MLTIGMVYWFLRMQESGAGTALERRSACSGK